MQSIRQYKKASILAPIYVVLEVALEIIIPLVMADLIDKGIDQGSMPDVVKFGIILLIAAMLSLLFGALAGICCHCLFWFCQKFAAGYVL